MIITEPQNTPPEQRLTWFSLLLMMLVAVFVGTIISATYIGNNAPLRSQIRSLLNLSTDSDRLLPINNPVNADIRSGIGVDGDPGGYILLSMDELEHFFYTNIETDPDFAEIQAEILAYGNEFRMINDVNNLITFNNVVDEIQRPGSALELMMRSFYQLLDHYNNTDEQHLPCLVMYYHLHEAREILIQLRIPPGTADNRIIHDKPYIIPQETSDFANVTCYFSPQSS